DPAPTPAFHSHVECRHNSAHAPGPVPSRVPTHDVTLITTTLIIPVPAGEVTSKPRADTEPPAARHNGAPRRYVAPTRCFQPSKARRRRHGSDEFLVRAAGNFH